MPKRRPPQIHPHGVQKWHPFLPQQRDLPGDARMIQPSFGELALLRDHPKPAQEPRLLLGQLRQDIGRVTRRDVERGACFA